MNKEIEKFLDLMIYGVHFEKDGERVSPNEVYTKEVKNERR